MLKLSIKDHPANPNPAVGEAKTLSAGFSAYFQAGFAATAAPAPIAAFSPVVNSSSLMGAPSRAAVCSYVLGCMPLPF